MNTKNHPPSQRVQATRQRLLEAAGKQLLLKGFAGATTRSIAEAAGVSELTLFRHFPSKKDLFAALFETYSPKARIQDSISGMLTGEVRQDLITIGRQSYLSFIERRDAMLMAFSSTENIEELRQLVAQQGRQARQMVALYLQSQMAAGKIKALDPQLSAQVFIGMLFMHVVQQPMLGEPFLPADTLVPVCVDIFLNGLEK